MGKRKKRREHSGSGGSSSNSSDTKLVSSVLNETNTVLHGETVMQSSAQLNAPVQHLATSTPVMNSQQQYMQMLNSPILSPSLNQADVDIWLRTILIVRKETRCRHIGYSYRLTARVLLYAPSH